MGTSSRRHSLGNQRRWGPMVAALPTSNDTYSAAAESTHTIACLNRGQTSRPRTLGAITKTSHALGPRTKQSHSDVVNNSAHTGLREPIAQPLLSLITLESNTHANTPTTLPQLDYNTKLPATQQRIYPVCHDPLPWQMAVRPLWSTSKADLPADAL